MARPKNRRGSGKFLKLPHVWINSAEYLALSHNAKVLLVDLAAQYNGFNNGDLSAEFSAMKKRGWKSKTPLFNARKELEESGFTVRTKVWTIGRAQRGTNNLSRKPNCYAITWWAIDVADQEMTNYKPGSTALNLWKKPGGLNQDS